MSQKRIRALYESRLKAWATARPVQLLVEFQNTKFDPPQDGMYLRAYLLPATTTSEDLAGRQRTYRGVFQVSIVVPAGQGSTAAQGIADELAELFPLALRLTAGDLTVQIASPATEAAPFVSGLEYVIPVSFGYRADINV